MLETLNSSYIHAANSDNFNELVLQNSEQGPVLVNFWSRKAGPCMRQYPILDKIVYHYQGKLLLVNMDTESEFVFTREYGITSVPTLKLFRYGEVVETLHGYQSENDLIKLLDKYVVSESDLILADVIHLYSEGKQSAAYEKITEAIIDEPDNPRLPLVLCKLLKHEGRIEEALQIISSLPENIRTNTEIEQFGELLGFYQEARALADLEHAVEQETTPLQESIRNRCQIAEYVVRGQYEEALVLLMDGLSADPKFLDSDARNVILRIFRVLGQDHTLVKKYRTSLQRFTN